MASSNFTLKKMMKNYNEEVKFRKEAEDALCRKEVAIELMKLLLESYKEENVKLHLHAQCLEQKYQETETNYTSEQEKLSSQVRTWQDKYDQELSLRKETEDSLCRHKQELEIVKGLVEEADAMMRQPPPASLFCPITQEVMKDAHIAADGFTYEGDAIRTWLSRGHDTSPMTNLKLPHRNLIPNRALRSAIRDFI